MDNLALLVAHVTKQCRSGSTEAKDRIFDHGLARAHRGKEIPEVVIAVAIAGRRYIFLIS